jgi:bifunctional non-homologous end joining protein LigD
MKPVTACGKWAWRRFVEQPAARGCMLSCRLRPKSTGRSRSFSVAPSQRQWRRNIPPVLAHLKIANRRGHILIDWLRNGLGATAVASFSPRARPGATVATPVTWAEVTPKLDPSRFTVRSVPERLAKLNQDPWQGFDKGAQRLPDPVLTRTTTPVGSEASHVG